MIENYLVKRILTTMDITTWEKSKQIIHACVEELSELSAIISKGFRLGCFDTELIIHELADVYVTLEGLRATLGIHDYNIINKIKKVCERYESEQP